MTETFTTIRETSGSYGVTARRLRVFAFRDLLCPVREGRTRLCTRRDRTRLKLILRGKRFGFALEEIRQLPDLYDFGDQQQTRYRQTMERARVQLETLVDRRAALDGAIGDLSERIDRRPRRLATMDQGAAPATARDAGQTPG